ncbi:hypothetical protein B0H63DRAFT_150026 [Podospora didyma]|uniref:C2H2-type domain-containing protein n=1 Tax=Podospora didyma TaxID=330526 RepID=A0AAE0NTC6_9PEZI|nr:hypothetical protein B0H63DRAFT_150026 [Podospora didyma]
MPYDADSESAGSSHIYPETPSSTSNDESAHLRENGSRLHVQPQQEASDEPHNGFENYFGREIDDDEFEYEENTDYDLPRPGDDTQSPTPPQDHLPFQTGLVPSQRSSQVAVLLQSSPPKDAFARLPDDVLLSNEDDDEGSQGHLVASDLVPTPNFYIGVPVSRASLVPSHPDREPSAKPSSAPPSLPPTKKRGRPVGWKAGSGSYSALNGNISEPQPKIRKTPGDLKRRGRPHKLPAPTPREIYLGLSPKWVPFYCEWEGCPAQLHNMETLRKHVAIVHGYLGVCKWAKCANPPPEIEPRHFTREEFAAHIAKAHLLPFVWHVGDGPQNSATLDNATRMMGDADPLPPYLFDEDGNQVTPSIKGQEFEDDDERKRKKHRLYQLMVDRDNNAPEEPQYTQAQLDDIADADAAKKAKQKMFRSYHDRIMGGSTGQISPYNPLVRGITS